MRVIVIILNTIYLNILFNFYGIVSLSFQLKPFQIANDSTITYPSILSSIPYTLPTINLCFGTPNNQCFNLSPATTTTYTVLQASNVSLMTFNHSFNKAMSSSSINLNHYLGLPLFNNYINGIIIQDIVSLPNTSFNLNPSYKNSFTIFLLESIHKPTANTIDGFLGLQKFQSNEIIFKHQNASFMDYLYNISLIYKKNFALSYSNKDSFIHFGNDYGYYNKCISRKYDNDNINWDCIIEDIRIGSLVIPGRRQKVIFDSLTSIITAPMKMKEFIIKELLTKNQLQYCFFEEETHYVIMKCAEMIDYDTWNDIHILLEGNVELILRWRNMMKSITVMKNDKENIEYVSLLAFDVVPSTQWRIGLPGFIDNTIVFDRDDISIGLVQLSSLISRNDSNKNRLIKRYLGIIIISLCIGIVIFQVSKIKYHNLIS